MNLTSKHPAREFLRAASVSLTTLLVGSALHAQPDHVKLPEKARGAAAIAALGAHLPDVAKAYGLDKNKLIELFETQPSLGVDENGALNFVCEGLGVDHHEHKHAKKSAVEEAIAPNSSTSALLSGTNVDAFQLHSLPGASRVIFLDFDGHTTSGTSWNSSFAGGNNIVSQAFDLDGDPTTFNDHERALIQAIWKRVAEDYAPFAVDVTTQDPSVEALRKTTSSDTAFGIRVVISPTNWYNSGAGGVAYLGSFSWNTDTPCYAFTAQLANGEKYIAEAVSHEVGHTFGLYHDGASGSSATEYYMGQGNWAPIMGVGYYKSVTQFSKGDYANANNTQDDVSLIASLAPLVGDDHGNSVSTATALAVPTVASGGTIENRTDLDVFRFDTGAGDIALAIRNATSEPNLDIKAELLDSAGRILQISDPDTLDASINATLAAGTYYLRISGVGRGDPLVDGYPSYGSLGNYVITGNVVPNGGKQAPVAVASANTYSGPAPLTVSFTGSNSSDSDGTIVSYAWSFGDGQTSTAPNPSYTYTTPGTFVAALTVTDNDGLASSASVTINALAPPNTLPVAVASSSVNSGVAPLPVSFSSAGSFDPDGTIASYAWQFGDGTSSTAAAPTKTYSTPGNYTARLTVTDNRGDTASSSVQITVTSDPNAAIDVRQFTLTAVAGGGGNDSGRATVLVRDRLDRPIAGATITLQWSGLVSGTSTGKTDSAGQVILTSKASKKAGTFTATITGVTPPTGLTYDASIYTEPTSRSIAVK